MYNTHSQSVRNLKLETARKRSILLVDDDPIFRNMITSVLRVQGYDVIEAEHGLDGLAKLRTSDPDIVLCDLSMPVLNGIEFVEEASLQYPYLPLIVVSATEDMSQVAKALRLGIKDFLPKPISDFNYLDCAIKNTLKEAEHHLADQRDFSSQWFNVEEGGELPEEQELHWHLDYLQDNPEMAKELLSALLPEKEAYQGSWKCSYRLLQSADNMPIVFDYSWLINGQLAFYLVDSASTVDGDGTATTLLIRALFDDYIRNLKYLTPDLKQLAEVVERGIDCSDSAVPIDALFGVADFTSGSVSILPAGLKSTWLTAVKNQHIAAGSRLGQQCIKNFMTQELDLRSGGQVIMNQVEGSRFSLEITNTTLII
ncbi:two-component system response regulator [Vibrio sp. 10N.286.49.B3]|uniref:response regulator n=1 Tax=Vibrio sp. 10N.286.49.B3 TaxID=1880855 RepID=UPI000C832F0D|nr:response regulator [Vibrio sp. 10N.286.49.B3]PMH40580.1 two-component system response regulator [Vibrio sp. 10N.286.49.B3]